MLYCNFKNNKLYLYRGTGTDTTNERDGLVVVIYSPIDSLETFYVREQQEFNRKFFRVKSLEVISQ